MVQIAAPYNPGQQGLEITASPNVSTVQAQNDPEASKALQLAQSLGAAGPLLDQLSQKVNADTVDKATADANKMTVSELGAKIKSGEMLASQSPIYSATVQHVYGNNLAANLQQDTLSKLQLGQLKFTTNDDLDKYLTEQRNTQLAGQGDYTIAGFDKSWQQMRDNVMTANARVTNSEALTRGTAEATQNLSNIVKGFSTAAQPMTVEQKSQALLGGYDLLTKTHVLTPDQGRDALMNVMSEIAETGDTALLRDFTTRKVDGMEVGAFIGQRQATILDQHAQLQDDKNQRQRVDTEVWPFKKQAMLGQLDIQAWEDYGKKNERWLTADQKYSMEMENASAIRQMDKKIADAQTLQNQQTMNAANTAMVRDFIGGVGGKSAYLLPAQMWTLSNEGKMVPWDKDQAVKDQLALSTKDLDPASRIRAYEVNGVTEPMHTQMIQSGLTNLDSVGWGKTPGVINAQGQQAIQAYREVYNISPAAADRMAGKDAETMRHISFLMENGYPDPSQAATLVNQGTHLMTDPVKAAGMDKDVAAAVAKVINPHWYSGAVATVKGIFGNSEVNLTGVEGNIKTLSGILYSSGRYSDAQAAVNAAVDYYQRPAVSVKVNNTLYLRKDLPPAPKGYQQDELMERFINEVPGALAQTYGYSKGDVRLNPTGDGSFTAMVGGVPLRNAMGQVVPITKEAIGTWIGNTITADQKAAIKKANLRNSVNKAPAPLNNNESGGVPDFGGGN